MKRTKLVLAAAAVMVALLVAFAAPAMAKDRDRGHDNNHVFVNNNDSRFFDNDNRSFVSSDNRFFDDDNRFFIGNDNRFFDNGFIFNPFFDNNNGVFQTTEQEVESGDSSQTFNVVGGGDNSNACQGIQGISNTGNAVDTTNVLQDNPFNTGFSDGFFHPFFNNGFNEVEVDDVGNFEINPLQTTTCDQQVNQAASASG
jgi:hypothetical protein